MGVRYSGPSIFEEMPPRLRPSVREVSVIVGKTFYHVMHKVNETIYEVIVTPGLVDPDKVLIAVPTTGVSFWLENPRSVYLDAKVVREARFPHLGITDVSEIVRLMVGILGCSGRIWTDKEGVHLGKGSLGRVIK